MLMAILCLAGLCTLFFGYDFAVMPRANINPDYCKYMQSDSDSHEAAARIGSFVSFWFAGFLVGKPTALRSWPSLYLIGPILSGSYADSIRRVQTLQLSSLLAGANSSTWMGVARIISGVGCGYLNTISSI
ncbi:uncharacterized protein A1O9_00497 [Exophiala aquamarina CBS 119918]|uniref:Major facilitator superfamily (MFS) profile domain-containing protein n=1 Tax=Exophiala aquamarina CBS 119918 TaxID=1182545 RepID=A0A072PQX8_9EURO|nr:uncharacterized protein A1O9_00497 [Exophiala aquamarina CBS 119918]KEF62524.1 hypothetical protein A1O9_00497 [Exophiala aquamarina CBS 119918]